MLRIADEALYCVDLSSAYMCTHRMEWGEQKAAVKKTNSHQHTHTHTRTHTHTLAQWPQMLHSYIVSLANVLEILLQAGWKISTRSLERMLGIFVSSQATTLDISTIF